MDPHLGLSDTTWGIALTIACLFWLVSIPRDLAEEKYGLVAIDIGFAILCAVLATMNFMS